MSDSRETLPGDGAGAISPPSEAPTARWPEAGERLLFRRYRVIRELGRGGMGVVMLAHDTALGIDVAVKLVSDLLVKDDEAITDLRKEVLRGMALNHDGIVRTHNFERDESGAGIVMEYVDGHTLTALNLALPDGLFDPEQVLPWLEQLCPVLDYAHREAHIVHRDLKPGNIMFTTTGRVKVADFGIAATLSESMNRHSMEGTVSGTLSYMSPQQAQGMKPSHLDDIHALGATIYELLTGKPPFFRGTAATILSQAIHEVPPSLNARRQELEVHQKPPIPPLWEQTIAACLAKDPAERPQTCAEVVRRLRGEPEESAVPPRHRSRVWLAWSAAAVALAVGLIVGLRRPAARTSPAAVAATPPIMQPASATASSPYVNSLGQRFVPAGTAGVLFCVWETRLQDFQEFIKQSGYNMDKGEKAFTLSPKGWVQIGGTWIRPHFLPRQGGDHPVVCVSWHDSVAFCEWLTQRERAAGRLTVTQRYRLPNDAEWSVAAGLGDRESRSGTPASKDGKITGLFHWGTQWPPPMVRVGGNITGKEAGFTPAVPSHNDGFNRTSPVGTFRPNSFGLYDLEGNVHEWCADRYTTGEFRATVRGPAWESGEPKELFVSMRNSSLPGNRRASRGFRVVLSLSER